MRGGSGRPARIKSRNMKKLLFTLLFCAAAAAAAGSEPAELKLLSYNTVSYTHLTLPTKA